MLRGPVSTVVYGLYGPLINKLTDQATRTLHHYYDHYRRTNQAQNQQPHIRSVVEIAAVCSRSGKW